MTGLLFIFRVRRALLMSALVGAVSFVFAAAASAQTPFQASVKATGATPAGCPPTASFCGTANIAGYGTATWDFYALGFTGVPTRCGSTYQAQTDFTLASDPSSTLVLDESGDLCGLGAGGAAYRGYFAEGPQAAGHPFAIVGNWTVDPSSTGQFAGRTGSGTDLVNVAGFDAAGSYSGTVG